MERFLSRGQAEPSFLSVGFFEPHRRFDFGGARPDSSKGVSIPAYIPQETAEEREAAEEEFAALQGAIATVDAAIGRVLASLEKNGGAQNTVAIFTADHGIAFPGAKATLYDPGIEVPCIMRGPGIGRGLRLPGPISNVDYVPTLLEMIDGGPPAEGAGGSPDGSGPPLQGESFWPHISSQGLLPSPRSHVFAEKNFHAFYDPMRCIRGKRYKYIVNFEYGPAIDVPSDITNGAVFKTSAARYFRKRVPYELYDMVTDPEETTNLGGTSEFDRVENECRQKLTQWLRSTEDFILDGPPKSVYYRRRIAELGSD